MASSVQALTLVAVALLPGAFFVWGFERNAGRYGISLRDRALRLVGTSAVFLAVFVRILYLLYTNYWDSFTSGEPLPGWIWSLPVIYVGVPGVLGWAFGKEVRRGTRWARALAGRARAPRAWDHLFQDSPSGYVRCRMKSGLWVAGGYGEDNGRKPYASGYPDAQEIYLTRLFHVDPLTGGFQFDENGNIAVGSGALLIAWEEVELMEFIFEPEEDEPGAKP